MKTLSLFSVVGLFFSVSRAAQITAVPGPDDQGGMIMPMVTITATSGPASDPTEGTVNVDFSPASVPVLAPLTQWSPGDWFAETAAWRPDLSPVDGSVVGMPSANAGDGDFFNNQYGFMFMSMGNMMMANVPTGNSLAIKLTSITSPDLNPSTMAMPSTAGIRYLTVRVRRCFGTAPCGTIISRCRRARLPAPTPPNLKSS